MSRVTREKKKKKRKERKWKGRGTRVCGITLINNQEVDLKGSTPIAKVTRGDKDLLGKLRLYV